MDGHVIPTCKVRRDETKEDGKATRKGGGGSARFWSAGRGVNCQVVLGRHMRFRLLEQGPHQGAAIGAMSGCVRLREQTAHTFVDSRVSSRDWRSMRPLHSVVSSWPPLLPEKLHWSLDLDAALSLSFALKSPAMHAVPEVNVGCRWAVLWTPTIPTRLSQLPEIWAIA